MANEGIFYVKLNSNGEELVGEFSECCLNWTFEDLIAKMLSSYSGRDLSEGELETLSGVQRVFNGREERELSVIMKCNDKSRKQYQVEENEIGVVGGHMVSIYDSANKYVSNFLRTESFPNNDAQNNKQYFDLTLVDVVM